MTDLIMQTHQFAEEYEMCFCIGPQNGEPLCPCRMRSVRIIKGRYVETIDHGPAPKDTSAQRAGGLARASKLDSLRRSEIASIAAKARWAKGNRRDQMNDCGGP